MHTGLLLGFESLIIIIFLHLLLLGLLIVDGVRSGWEYKSEQYQQQLRGDVLP